MGADGSLEATSSWELTPGRRADGRDPADPETGIRSQPGARPGPMPTIHVRRVFRLGAGQLLSQTVGGLAQGAGTAAADADRRGETGAGEQGDRQPKKVIAAGMGRSSE